MIYKVIGIFLRKIWKHIHCCKFAIRRGAERITLLGATGTRLDHVLGNIELLGIGLKAGIPIQICDAHNRIRMIDRGMTLARKEQFGTYVSLIPYTECVEHLTLTGLKYPLTDACLRGFCSLGVSNEIVADTAEISFESGILLVVESKDRWQKMIAAIISIELFLGISNIIRRSHRGISDENAAGNSVQKMWHF